ncbi:MAG: SH3 domain-containing protein [Cytophagaceae bacterium]|nr:SH3 domain-containing protein [Gemmatimonadaceae bacterium]
MATRAPSRSGAVRWRNVVARNWVTVRAAPQHGSRLLGSFGPDTRIQLGESRAGWVRIRSRGLSGWAHQARLSTRTVRAGTLAQR